jgi:hypothetical protein
MLSIVAADSERQVKIINTLPVGNMPSANRTIVARFDVPTAFDADLTFYRLNSTSYSQFNYTLSSLGFNFESIEMEVLPYAGATTSTTQYWLHAMIR